MKEDFMSLIEFRTILTSIMTVLLLYIASDIITGESLVLTEFAAAGIIVGFLAGPTIKRGSFNGAMAGITGGLVVTALMVVFMYLEGYGQYMAIIISTLIMYLVLEIIVCTAGACIGCLIKKESLNTIK